METSLPALLHNVVKKFKKKTAIIEDRKEIYYGDLWEKIDRLSTKFYKIGIRENDRVALILPNSAEFIYCFFALLNINAIVSPLSPDMTLFELKSILDNLKPHVIISVSALAERGLQQSCLLFNEKIVIIQNKVSTSELRLKHYYELNQLYYECERNMNCCAQADANKIATINYTYRGIGRALGAVLSHKNFIDEISAYIENTRMCFEHRVLSFLPPANVYPLVGCMLAPLMCGATIVISNNYLPRAILKIIEEYKINHFTTVPSIYMLLMREYRIRNADLSSLTCCITGGAYMTPEMLASIEHITGIEIFQGYGLTECLPITWNRYEYNKPGTLGLPLRSDFLIRIVDETDVDRAVNRIGEIIIKTPTLMQGYYDNLDETNKVLKQGWFYTGDLGYLDEEGYLHFAGLKKNIAKVSGNMVDLKEVQDVLLSHPAVSDAIVYAKEDVLWGHVIAAHVKYSSSVYLRENELRDYCSKYLSRYKIPKEIKL